MGGSSSQVVGYRYYASFLAFIGNRIENLISINFDKRGWQSGRQVPMGENGKMMYIHLPNIYGENEGGVRGALCIKYGSNTQTPDPAYEKYMESIGSVASAYPYQSYISFSSGELSSELESLTDDELQDLADQYTDGIIPGRGFYLGNSGYMKEMLLWVKRTRVRNDGRRQWYETRQDGAIVCEIGSFKLIQPNSNTYPSNGIITTTKRWYDDINGVSHEYADDVQFSKGDVIADITHGVASSGANLSGYSRVETSISGMFSGIVEVRAIVKVTGALRSAGLLQTEGLLYINTTKKTIYEGATEEFEIVAYVATPQPIIKVYAEAKIGVSVDGTEMELRSASIESTFIHHDKPTYLVDTEYLDINPVHKIREILTDDTAMGKPETDVNDQNFMKAADRIWDEGLGVSWAIDEKSCIDAIEELCYHIEAGVRVNRQTGLYEIVLFRDDWFSEEEVHDIAENKIKDLSLEVMNGDDIVNQLNVTYYDRQRIKNSTFSVYENGSILTMGHTNAESVEFPYFMNMRNAEVVANWKLKQFSTPAWSGSFTTGWREARKWNRYDLIRLPWSKKWNGTILVRIMKINLGNGTDNTVTIDFEEVVPYSGEMNTSIVVDTPVDAGPQPPQPSINAVFEAPYYLTVLRAGQTNADLELSNNPDIGYVAAIAAKPQSNSLNALLYTDGGAGEFEQVSRLDYCDILQLDQPIAETTSSFVVTGSLTQTANSNNLILLNGELMGFVAFDDATKFLTVKRGVLDTVPKKHNSGSLFVFDLPDVAFDSTQYAQSEIVEAQVLTTTPSGIQELSTGTAVEIQSRAIRPYPPANVKINNTFMPLYIDGGLQLTWSDRNRLQQTGGEIIGYFEGSVGLELGTQTLLTVTEYDADDLELSTQNANATAVNNFILTEAEMSPGVKKIRILLKTVRDDYECLSPFDHTIFISNLAAPANVTFEVIEY
ncbi:hypothetical protein [Acinetobacter junii]|uniref:hypothetical protein n=1 Tax=Acinetobacter junii TaxID=40215 RepID=UPI0002D658A6|nr:hypothetical protein [Acinetobacter junii]